MTPRPLREAAGHLHDRIFEPHTIARTEPHRNLRAPDSNDATTAAITALTVEAIQRRKVLGGLINEYQQAV